MTNLKTTCSVTEIMPRRSIPFFTVRQTVSSKPIWMANSYPCCPITGVMPFRIIPFFEKVQAVSSKPIWMADF
jgi:hypothetical protein